MTPAPRLNRGPVRLVPFEDRHLSETYLGWLNDPAVMRYSEQRHRRHDIESCRAFVAGFATGPGLLWAIEAGDQDGRHIGNITVRVDPHNRLADISILIGAGGCQGKGYGLNAWAAVLAHLAGRPDLHKITGGCMAANRAMVRIMERTGMAFDGRRPAHYLLDGDPTDLVYYATPGRWAP